MLAYDLGALQLKKQLRLMLLWILTSAALISGSLEAVLNHVLFDG
ncbi:hypothetical protein Plhal304r1_c034g0107681 [Plasmopara halstedii]